MNLNSHDIKNHINQEAKQDLLYIDNLNGNQFENYMTNILNHVGYHNVIHTPYSNDHGADAISYTDSISWQFKNYKHTVPFHAVEEVMFSARYYHTKTNVVLTNSYFSNNTINTVNKMNNFNPTSPIILIDRPKLFKILTDYEAYKPATSARLKKQRLHKKEDRVLEAYKYNKAIEININKSKQIYNFKNRAKQFAFYALRSIVPYKNLLLDFEDVTLRDTYYNIINHILNAKVFKGRNWSTGYINNGYPYGHQDIKAKYYGMIIKHPIYYKNVKAFMYIPIIYYPPEAINMYKDYSPQDLRYPYQNMMLPWKQLTKPFRTKYNGFLLNTCCIISNCIFNPWSPNNAINNSYTLLNAPNYVSANGNFSFNDARTIYLSTYNNFSNNIREAERNFIQNQLHRAKSYERGVIPNNIINEQTPEDLFHKLREVKNKTFYKHWKARNKAINKKKNFQHKQEKNLQQINNIVRHQINDINLDPYKYHQEQQNDNVQVKKHTQQLKIKQERYDNKYRQITYNKQHNFKSDNKIKQNNSINSKVKNIVKHIISRIQNKERYY